MQRLFPVHHLRRGVRLSPLWSLTTLDAGGLGRPVKAAVPCVWESIPGLKCYKGRVAYENTFEGGGTLRFVFGGVAFRAKVYLDGELIAEHYGAFTAFDAIAERVPHGMHTLRIEADNRYGEDSALHVENDYYSFGGVSRPVDVQQIESAYLTDLFIRTSCEDGQWMADVQVTAVSLSDEDQTASVFVSAASSEHIFRSFCLPARESVTLRASMPAQDVKLWSAEEPNLYDASAVLYLDGRPVDDLCDRFGYREVKLEGRKILIVFLSDSVKA